MVDLCPIRLMTPLWNDLYNTRVLRSYFTCKTYAINHDTATTVCTCLTKRKKKKIEISREGSTAAKYNNLLSVFIYYIYINRVLRNHGNWAVLSVLHQSTSAQSFFSAFIYFVINGETDQIIYKSFCQTNESIDIEILKYYISFSYIDDSPLIYLQSLLYNIIWWGAVPYMCRDNGLCKSISPPPPYSVHNIVISTWSTYPAISKAEHSCTYYV